MCALAAAPNTSLHGSAVCGIGPVAELSALLVLLLDHSQTQETTAGTACSSSHRIRSDSTQAAVVHACAYLCEGVFRNMPETPYLFYTIEWTWRNFPMRVPSYCLGIQSDLVFGAA